jgi:hypothetical protein
MLLKFLKKLCLLLHDLSLLQLFVYLMLLLFSLDNLLVSDMDGLIAALLGYLIRMSIDGRLTLYLPSSKINRMIRFQLSLLFQLTHLLLFLLLELLKTQDYITTSAGSGG